MTVWGLDYNGGTGEFGKGSCYYFQKKGPSISLLLTTLEGKGAKAESAGHITSNAACNSLATLDGPGTLQASSLCSVAVTGEMEFEIDAGQGMCVTVNAPFQQSVQCCRP